MTKLRCSKCKQVKLAGEFYRMRQRGAEGRRPECKACTRAVQGKNGMVPVSKLKAVLEEGYARAGSMYKFAMVSGVGYATLERIKKDKILRVKHETAVKIIGGVVELRKIGVIWACVDCGRSVSRRSVRCEKCNQAWRKRNVGRDERSRFAAA